MGKNYVQKLETILSFLNKILSNRSNFQHRDTEDTEEIT